MELLNLDSIMKVQRQIVIGGVNYDILDQSVGQMITTLQMQKILEKENNEAEVMNQVVVSIQEIIPACPEKIIRSLPMRAINAIFEFANASDKDVVENSKDETEDGEAEKK